MKKHIDLIWNYNYWANRRIVARVESLTDAQITERAPYMWESILRTLAHTLGADWIWRQRIQEGLSPTSSDYQAQFTTLELLKAGWAEEEAAMRAYLAGVGDSDLERVVKYKSANGNPFSRPLWQILTHVVNHGTQHRSEVAVYLTHFDRSPGNMDITAYLIEQGQ